MKSEWLYGLLIFAAGLLVGCGKTDADKRQMTFGEWAKTIHVGDVMPEELKDRLVEEIPGMTKWYDWRTGKFYTCKNDAIVAIWSK